MANIYEPTAEIRKARDKWVEMLPPDIAAVARIFEPWKAYRIKSTGMPVHLVGINGNATLTLEEDKGITNNGMILTQVDPADVEEAEAPEWVVTEAELVEKIRQEAHAKACAAIGSGETIMEVAVMPETLMAGTKGEN